MFNVLQDLVREYNMDNNNYILEAMMYLRNKNIVKKRFSTYNTRGYKVLLGEKKDVKEQYCRAYFIYNSIL